MTNTLFFLQEPDHSEMVRWACSQIPWMPYSDTMRAVAIGDDKGNGVVEHLAVCLFHNFTARQDVDFRDGRGKRPAFGLCEISFAARSPRWATRGIISSLLQIPFLQYNVRKVVTVIPSTNERAKRFNEGIGLKLEGTLRHHFAKDVHACIHGMMRSEWQTLWRDPQRARLAKPRKPIKRPTGSQAHGQPEGRIGATSA